MKMNKQDNSIPYIIVYLPMISHSCGNSIDKPPCFNTLRRKDIYSSIIQYCIYIMRKEDKINKAYTTAKAKHGDTTIVLFHIGDNYEAYYSDAQGIAELTLLHIYTVNKVIPFIRFSVEELEQYMNQLVDAGHSVCISEVRGTSGNYILEAYE